MTIACAYNDITRKTQVAVALDRFIAKCDVPRNDRVIQFSGFEAFKFARELLAKEIQFRRDRQWQVLYVDE